MNTLVIVGALNLIKTYNDTHAPGTMALQGQARVAGTPSGPASVNIRGTSVVMATGVRFLRRVPFMHYKYYNAREDGRDGAVGGRPVKGVCDLCKTLAWLLREIVAPLF